MKLYVGNISYDMDDASLEKTFSEFGAVESASVIKDRDSGRSKGFGFVEMEDSAAKAAMEALDGQEVLGRAIRVSEARPMRN